MAINYSLRALVFSEMTRRCLWDSGKRSCPCHGSETGPDSTTCLFLRAAPELGALDPFQNPMPASKRTETGFWHGLGSHRHIKPSKTCPAKCNHGTGRCVHVSLGCAHGFYWLSLDFTLQEIHSRVRRHMASSWQPAVGAVRAPGH